MFDPLKIRVLWRSLPWGVGIAFLIALVNDSPPDAFIWSAVVWTGLIAVGQWVRLEYAGRNPRCARCGKRRHYTAVVCPYCGPDTEAPD